MKIVDKIIKKQNDLQNSEPITIAFLSDSVTQGCFECYLKPNGAIETFFEYKNAYSTRLKEILNLLYPNVQFNIINSGISGDNAVNAQNRVERDILKYSPDLVVVSFGLNDSTAGLENLPNYKKALDSIFTQLKQANTEIIFLTQNYMNTTLSPHIKDEYFTNLSNQCSNIQNSGILKKYFDVAKELCKEKGIKVCDEYACWEKMEKAGVDITELLANKLNHPIREFHYYIAIKILETILD